MKKKGGVLGIFALAVLLSILSLLLSERTDAEVAFCQDNLIRLHVVANSDKEDDQQTKLMVRDAILGAMQGEYDRKSDSKEAYECLKAGEPSIRNAVESVLSDSTLKPEYSLQFGTFAFPDREYDGKLVPAGRYRALRVVLGKGEGENWWCVLFPPLCFEELCERTVDDHTDRAAEVYRSDPESARGSEIIDEADLREPKTVYRSGFLEWLKSLGAKGSAGTRENGGKAHPNEAKTSKMGTKEQ